MTKEMFTHNRKDDVFLMFASSRIKFIITEGVDGARHYVFFVSKHEHIDVTSEVLDNDPESTLLGAGDITREGIKWGSGSCYKNFGFDRPSETELADSLLAEVNMEFNELKAGLR